MHDLARHFQQGLLDDDALRLLPEEQLLQSLTAVRGIGPWTVHMFAMFHLGMADVLPVGA